MAAPTDSGPMAGAEDPLRYQGRKGGVGKNLSLPEAAVLQYCPIIAIHFLHCAANALREVGAVGADQICLAGETDGGTIFQAVFNNGQVVCKTTAVAFPLEVEQTHAVVRPQGQRVTGHGRGDAAGR